MTIKSIFNDTIKEFRENILNGELSFGTILPTEAELAQKMKVSRPTIAKIYNSLQSEGLVKKKQGSGTTVVYNKNKKQFTFGLLLPGSGESEIFGIINDHILELLKQKDFTCLWDGTIANNAEMRQNLIFKNCQTYIERQVDAVFFAPLERTGKTTFLNNRVCKIFDSVGIPIVLIDRDICPFPKRSKYDVVGIDNFRAGYIMTEHLIEGGCEKIHFFYRKDSAHSVSLRLEGCRAACFDAGIHFNQDNTFCGEPSDYGFIKKIAIVSKKTGILCANDSTAAVLMSSLNNLGLKVSVDFLMAGFDDMKYSKHLKVPLTTYKQPLLDIVMICFNAILIKLTNPHKTACTYNVEGKIIVRESTKFV
jgi:GntR family transcriptional regulator, arabinose operon transcriptional repressor